MTTAPRPQDVRPDDALLTWMGTREPPPDLIAEGANVAWLGRASRPGEAWVSGVGDEPAVVAALVEELAGRHAIDGVTVIEAAFELLPARLRSPDPGFWCHWMLDPRDAMPAVSGAIDIRLDDPRIGPVLAHSDSAHIFPGDERLVRWVGVERDSRLVSVAAQIVEPSGAAHLVSVCTEPDARGQGLARQTCGRLVEHAVSDGAPMIVLEMYTANEPGRRTYGALGFRETGRYASGLLAHALPPERS